MSKEPAATGAAKSSASDLLWIVVIALGVLWMGYVILRGPARVSLPPANVTRRGDYGMAEYAWKLRDLKGNLVDFEQYRGRPVFLNIWATWCPPCVSEMPSINSLAANTRLKDVAFLCVSVEDDLEVVSRFANSRGLKVPIFLGGAEAPTPFRTEGIPATFLINREGKIVSKYIGSAEWNEERVISAIESLAKTVK